MGCVIVGTSTLELDGRLGEIDSEWTLDGGRSCLALSQDEGFGRCVLAESPCVGPWVDGGWGDVGCKIPV